MGATARSKSGAGLTCGVENARRRPHARSMPHTTRMRLDRWIASQAAMGVSLQALLRWAVEGGFQEAEVQEAIERAKEDGVFEWAGCPALTSAERGAWRSEGVVCRLWMRHPEIALFDQVVSLGDGAAIIEAARLGLSASWVAKKKPSSSKGRASLSKTFERGECAPADELAARIAQVLGVDPVRLEPLQATLYPDQGFYAPHHDHFAKGDPRWGTARQRVATMVVYLDEPSVGGQTVIEPLGMRIAPARGSALYFAYPDEASRELCLHASAPCSGGKWVATQWICEGASRAP
jgi:prolyl 4-hydroxylase